MERAVQGTEEPLFPEEWNKSRISFLPVFPSAHSSQHCSQSSLHHARHCLPQSSPALPLLPALPTSAPHTVPICLPRLLHPCLSQYSQFVPLPSSFVPHQHSQSALPHTGASSRAFSMGWIVPQCPPVCPSVPSTRGLPMCPGVPTPASSSLYQRPPVTHTRAPQPAPVPPIPQTGAAPAVPTPSPQGAPNPPRASPSPRSCSPHRARGAGGWPRGRGCGGALGAGG